MRTRRKMERQQVRARKAQDRKLDSPALKISAKVRELRARVRRPQKTM